MTSRHSRATRILHGVLTLAVGVQLATSLIMRTPRADYPPNGFFAVHEVSGNAAVLIVLVFWAVIAVRTVGTDAGQLVPWLSRPRRQAFFADAARHWRALRRKRYPSFAETSPFRAGLNGLGLLLVTAMAGTGLVYYLAGAAGYQDQAIVGWAMGAHGLMASLLWLYLIGHGFATLMHHSAGEQDLNVMWSLDRTEQTKGTEHGSQR